VHAFKRRTYRGPGELLRDIRYLVGSRALVKKALGSGAISFPFRERLMMVVTEVNGCRYCSYYHSALSRRAGLSDEELRSLLAGRIPADSPKEELPALVYAQHWAATNSQPEPEAVQHLARTYGHEKADMIHAILRMIRAGNLLGNTWDCILNRATFGRLGLTARDASI
jgi:AhpD family alkylhydroperoxidase